MALDNLALRKGRVHHVDCWILLSASEQKIPSADHAQVEESAE